MADYLCRWPNGEFSIVSSRTKHDAIELLDEWGNAEQASLNRMSDCMFDFRLSDDGQIQLAAVGEATEEYIMETCYPELQKALNAAEGTDSEDSRKQIRQAVERERTRLWDNQRPAKPAATELGREIQKQLGAPSVVVDGIVRRIASQRFYKRDCQGKYFLHRAEAVRVLAWHSAPVARSLRAARCGPS